MNVISIVNDILFYMSITGTAAIVILLIVAKITKAEFIKNLLPTMTLIFFISWVMFIILTTVSVFIS